MGGKFDGDTLYEILQKINKNSGLLKVLKYPY